MECVTDRVGTLFGTFVMAVVWHSKVAMAIRIWAVMREGTKEESEVRSQESGVRIMAHRFHRFAQIF
jgi:hypothetical protein